MTASRTGNPIWAASGVLSVALFAAGLVFANVLASPGFPPLDASFERINAFFTEDRAAAIGLSVCHGLSALALLIFAAYLGGVLGRAERSHDRLATLAVGGGVLAAAFLLFSALPFWTLTRAEVAADRGAAHAVLVLSYLAGGQALALSFVAFVGAASLAVLRTQALPTWIGRLGLVAAALALASVASLIWDPAFTVLLIAALLTFLWIVAASIVLVRRARAEGA